VSPLQEHVPLAPLTTFAIGGTARFFLSAESVEEVRDGLHFAQTQMLPIFILGGGSNVLIADDGFDGLVIAIRIPGIIFSTEGARGKKINPKTNKTNIFILKILFFM
jgi:UDP-N-acetylmuramate dehydrogenase